MIRKRNIKITGTRDPTFLITIESRLAGEKGIISLKFDRRDTVMFVEYDLNKVTFKEIENKLKQWGLQLSNSFFAKLRRGMYNFTELNELDDLLAEPTSCCEDPKNSHRI